MAIIFATKDSSGKAITFTLVRGTRWDDDFILTNQTTGLPIDLTGIVAMVMRIRKTIGGPIVRELSIAAGTLVLVDAVAGRVGIRCNSAFTLGFPDNSHRKAKYGCDAVIERTSGEYEPAIGAKVRVLPQYTRLPGAT